MCVAAGMLRADDNKGFIFMHFAVPQLVREIFASSTDDSLVAGASEASVRALGVSQPVLARFQSDIAVQCPALVHEMQMGLAGK
jgi:hypothetical protein